MEPIYNNFDGLDVSFQGALPESILNQLAEARTKAQNEKREIPIELGPEKVPVMVAETGSRGGYKYRFDTGLDGEIWFVAHSINSKNWNIRVSVKSLALALHGYEGAKSAILNRLIALNATGLSRSDSVNGAKNGVTNTPLERISRLDYCFDFIMDSAFMPLPCRFIAHQRSKKHVYGEQGAIETYSALNGEKVNTIRIGEMPGRQATIYNKTKEINSNAKKYWWDIWDIDRHSLKDDCRQIWRIEVRAGRDELDKWGFKRFEDLESKAGDVIAAILKAIRYTEPLENDANRARWPMAPIWQGALNTASGALAAYSSKARRENILDDFKENIQQGYKERLIGNAIGLTAAEGRDISEVTTVLEELQELISSIAKENPEALIKKYEKAEDRFRFLK